MTIVDDVYADDDVDVDVDDVDVDDDDVACRSG